MCVCNLVCVSSTDLFSPPDQECEALGRANRGWDDQMEYHDAGDEVQLCELFLGLSVPFLAEHAPLYLAGRPSSVFLPSAPVLLLSPLLRRPTLPAVSLSPSEPRLSIPPPLPSFPASSLPSIPVIQRASSSPAEQSTAARQAQPSRLPRLSRLPSLAGASIHAIRGSRPSTSSPEPH
jgi:hypothetical protein